MPRTPAGTAIAIWVPISSCRLGILSASRPASGDSTSIGRNCRPVVMPRAAPLPPDSCSTSQSCPTRCIQVPTLDTRAPAAYRR